jgi:transposase
MRRVLRRFRRHCQANYAAVSAHVYRLSLKREETRAACGLTVGRYSDKIWASCAVCEVAMPLSDEKSAALHAAHALNAHPTGVRDPLFLQGEPFFDARDLVQVKYEMLRRVHHDGQSVTATAAAFGLSRPAFYAAQAAWHAEGLLGLVPARPGPRGGHKLTAEVIAFLVEQRRRDPSLRPGALVALVNERFGLVVHPRSVERALAKHTQAAGRTPS